MAVLVESVLTRDNLVRAMITDRKSVAERDAGAGASAPIAPAWLAALALGGVQGPQDPTAPQSGPR